MSPLRKGSQKGEKIRSAAFLDVPEANGKSIQTWVAIGAGKPRTTAGTDARKCASPGGADKRGVTVIRAPAEGGSGGG